MAENLFRSLAWSSCTLALVLVVLGAYVRLSDAGLGCPDWPGCYGRISVPATQEHVRAANRAYPQRPVEAHKAWKEMVHRYVAGALGLMVLALALLARRISSDRVPQRLPFALLVLVIFQALLGMWTVTLLLKPLVVTAHLLGGMATLALLFWLCLATGARAGDGRAVEFEYGRPERGGRRGVKRDRDLHFSMTREIENPSIARAGQSGFGLRFVAAFALALLTAQIFLGGWTSSNYAALACTDLPTCHGQWWPRMDFDNAFVLWRGLGVNYEYGVLDNPARTAIHMTHRLGALAVSLTFIALGLGLWRSRQRRWRILGAVLLGALALQLALGLSIVWFKLPLLLAAAHNGGAALLLLATVALNYYAWRDNE